MPALLTVIVTFAYSLSLFNTFVPEQGAQNSMWLCGHDFTSILFSSGIYLALPVIKFVSFFSMLFDWALLVLSPADLSATKLSIH